MNGVGLLDGPLQPRRLAIVRMLVCGFATGYVAIRASHIWAVTRLDASRFDPVGIVSMLIDNPLGSLWVGGLLVATIAAGGAATLGWHHRWTGPAFGALLWWTISYRLSWGQVLHTENLMVLHVVILGFGRSGDALSLDARRDQRSERPSRRYAWPLQLMTALTALTYLIAAWAKIRNGGVEWMTGDVLRNQIAYDNLRKHLLGDYHSAFGGWLTRHGWIFPPLAIASMVIELGAGAALVRSRLRYWWVGAAWFFHLGVLALMAIMFPYQVFGLAYLSALPVERAWDATVRAARRRAPFGSHQISGL